MPETIMTTMMIKTAVQNSNLLSTLLCIVVYIIPAKLLKLVVN